MVYNHDYDPRENTGRVFLQTITDRVEVDLPSHSRRFSSSFRPTTWFYSNFKCKYYVQLKVVPFQEFEYSVTAWHTVAYHSNHWEPSGRIQKSWKRVHCSFHLYVVASTQFILYHTKHICNEFTLDSFRVCVGITETPTFDCVDSWDKEILESTDDWSADNWACETMDGLGGGARRDRSDGGTKAGVALRDIKDGPCFDDIWGDAFGVEISGCDGDGTSFVISDGFKEAVFGIVVFGVGAVFDCKDDEGGSSSINAPFVFFGSSETISTNSKYLSTTVMVENTRCLRIGSYVVWRT
jgi:hypothetical protein